MHVYPVSRVQDITADPDTRLAIAPVLRGVRVPAFAGMTIHPHAAPGNASIGTLR